MENNSNSINVSKNKEINALVEKVGNSGIASIKSVVVQLISVINNPRSSAKDLQNIIEKDPPLSIRLLKLANSSFYGFRRKISGIQEAIVGIGFDTVKEIALGQKISEIFKSGDCPHGYSGNALWKHSVAVAICNKLIHMREFRHIGDNVYSSGLLHDIGIIVEDQFLHEKFIETLEESNSSKQNLLDAENSIIGYNHSRIGMVISRAWNFPDELVMSIGFHHDPGKVEEKFKKFTSTLYISNHACQLNNIGYNDSPYINDSLYKECLRKVNITEEAVEIIMEDVHEEINNMVEAGWLDDDC